MNINKCFTYNLLKKGNRLKKSVLTNLYCIFDNALNSIIIIS